MSIPWSNLTCGPSAALPAITRHTPTTGRSDRSAILFKNRAADSKTMFDLRGLIHGSNPSDDCSSGSRARDQFIGETEFTNTFAPWSSFIVKTSAILTA